MKLTTSQFIGAVLINLLCVAIVTQHIMAETVRVEVKHEVKTEYKDRVVDKCDAIESKTTLMKVAANICGRTNNKVADYHVDGANNPVYKCD